MQEIKVEMVIYWGGEMMMKCIDKMRCYELR